MLLQTKQGYAAATICDLDQDLTYISSHRTVADFINIYPSST